MIQRFPGNFRLLDDELRQGGVVRAEGLSRKTVFIVEIGERKIFPGISHGDGLLHLRAADDHGSAFNDGLCLHKRSIGACHLKPQ